MRGYIEIIDMHNHIGDILYPSGGELIFRAGIKFPPSRGLQLLDEKYLFRDKPIGRALNKLFPRWSVNCERARNASATLENFRKSIPDNIKLCACLPVAPNTTHEDMRKAAEKEPRILAFASPDFTLNIADMEKKLAADIAAGAAGVKIHPIIQGTAADSEAVTAAAQVIANSGPVPIVLHTGRAAYYTPKENKAHFADNASAEKTERLVSAFPNVNFVVAHAGLNESALYAKLLKNHKNVYADTSFQPPEIIGDLISWYGADKILFGSDWPYGLRAPAVSAVCEACGGDEALLKAVFYDNAAALLGLI